MSGTSEYRNWDHNMLRDTLAVAEASNFPEDAELITELKTEIARRNEVQRGIRERQELWGD